MEKPKIRKCISQIAAFCSKKFSSTKENRICHKCAILIEKRKYAQKNITMTEDKSWENIWRQNKHV